ncbi:zinc finger protein 280C-like [Microtus oregoni]|uniref:zinc finger protein 280C-like n=1 Tax=Microtus oregoni TaxID=111838 RepID=UPI001BB1D2D0|nr:zinc finger protein 280C-like [Microtus oregoni]
MAELVMECEEEELEPWQQKVDEIQNKDDDDDELIFVGEISSSKPAISNILNRCSPGSSSKGLKNYSLNPAISNIFRPANRHYKNPLHNPVAALRRFHPKSKSSENSGVQTVFKPSFSKTSSQDDPGASILQLDSTKDKPSYSILKRSTEGIEQTSLGLKHPSTSKLNSVNPKKPKTNESVSETNPSSSSSLNKSPSEASSQVVLSNENTSSIQAETGAPSLRSCPKCKVKFSFLDPLKCHMKRCCPDMINNFLETVKSEHSTTENKANIGSDKEKLIVLVSDFYYGRHEGAVEEDLKTYTTFKCFSCSKVLKNNIRLMNHMKHHLEHEKQNSESWESHTTCQHCYRQYPNPFQLQCHIESTHTPHDFSTICKICELSFETEHMLLQHMKDTHKPGEMPYICQVCQFRSSIFSDVETHFRSSHENTKNLLCPFCLKVSRMATPYMNHYMKHQNKGIYRCQKCRLQFLTCKEKTDHKLEHRTFIEPKGLEGLPPGTKVSIKYVVSYSHSDHPSKQLYIFKKHSRALRGITLVCLKCDFLADTSGLDRMAKHLNQRKTHTCQVVIENVTERSLTYESTSE